MNDEREAIMRRVLRDALVLLNRVKELEKSPIDFGTGHPLTPSEIHTIEAIGDDPGINGRDLAEKMGVTKGAVSQMVKKLSHRGLIKKARSINNEREVLHLLTQSGWRAYRGHETFHKHLFADFITSLGDVPLKHFEILDALLPRLDQYLQWFIRDKLSNLRCQPNYGFRQKK